MNLIELAELLEGLGYPLSYSHFKNAQSAPFITYLVTSVDTLSADNAAIHESVNVDIELYVSAKSIQIENEIKELLRANELPFDYVENYIKEEGVFKCTFSIQLL